MLSAMEKGNQTRLREIKGDGGTMEGCGVPFQTGVVEEARPEVSDEKLSPAAFYEQPDRQREMLLANSIRSCRLF